MSHATFDAQALGAAPLRIRFEILPGLVIQTIVTGAQRTFATIAIMYLKTPLWTTTLSVVLPSAVIDHPVVAGGVTFETGASFALRPPAGPDQGMVMAHAILDYAGTQTPLDSAVAMWPESSLAQTIFPD